MIMKATHLEVPAVSHNVTYALQPPNSGGPQVVQLNGPGDYFRGLPHLIFTSARPGRQHYLHFPAEKTEVHRRSALARDHSWSGQGAVPRLPEYPRPEGVVSGLATWCHSLQTVGRLTSGGVGPCTGD